MKVCIVILVLYLLTSDQVLALRSKRSTKTAKSAKSTCPKDLACDKLGADCTVTREEFENQIVGDGIVWLNYYSVAFPNPSDSEKVKLRWLQSGDDVTRETSITKPTECQFQVFNLTIVADTECGIELNEVNGGPRNDEFCSQDLTEYLITNVCVFRNAMGCQAGFVGLLIPDNRPDNTTFPDTSTLPWAKINQDWFTIVSTYSPAAPFPKFEWEGSECPFTEP